MLYPLIVMERQSRIRMELFFSLESGILPVGWFTLKLGRVHARLLAGFQVGKSCALTPTLAPRDPSANMSIHEELKFKL
jgi:hypothetical protein